MILFKFLGSEMAEHTGNPSKISVALRFEYYYLNWKKQIYYLQSHQAVVLQDVDGSDGLRNGQSFHLASS